MAGGVYLPMRMKRKELEEVNDDFSEFSLSSPPTKIRRLDAELPPIMEEEEAEIIPVNSMEDEEELGGGAGGPPLNVMEELVPLTASVANEERAIVLFKPLINNTTTPTPLFHSPSDFSVSLSPHIISGFKNQVLWSSQSNPIKSLEDEAATRDNNTVATNECLAVVPWLPSQFPSTLGMEVSQPEVSELMEDEEMEAATMDIEDNNVSTEQGQGNDEFGEMRENEGLHQWQQQQQQQHCMIPQLPQNTSTPIVWFR